MRKRTRARELALQVLYQIDLRGPATPEELEEMLRDSGKPDDVLDFARVLVRGTLERMEEADSWISEAAEHWDIRRMAVIDRNVLRMAVYEMLGREDIPAKVTINEAIELGKKYSTENSGGFVNGILDRIRRTIEKAG
jgi:transcription antitermination factor NusB